MHAKLGVTQVDTQIETLKICRNFDEKIKTIMIVSFQILISKILIRTNQYGIAGSKFTSGSMIFL